MSTRFALTSPRKGSSRRAIYEIARPHSSLRQFLYGVIGGKAGTESVCRDVRYSGNRTISSPGNVERAPLVGKSAGPILERARDSQTQMFRF